jgi:hypothetical protein
MWLLLKPTTLHLHLRLDLKSTKPIMAPSTRSTRGCSKSSDSDNEFNNTKDACTNAPSEKSFRKWFVRDTEMTDALMISTKARDIVTNPLYAMPKLIEAPVWDLGIVKFKMEDAQAQSPNMDFFSLPRELRDEVHLLYASLI